MGTLEAFRAEGLKIGFYHSLLDWHHPEFPIDGLHPQRDDEQAQAAAKGRDVSRYADYLHGQVRELLTGYGPVDYLFFDFSYPSRTWGGKGRADWRSILKEISISRRRSAPASGASRLPESA